MINKHLEIPESNSNILFLHRDFRMILVFINAAHFTFHFDRNSFFNRILLLMLKSQSIYQKHCILGDIFGKVVLVTRNSFVP